MNTDTIFVQEVTQDNEYQYLNDVANANLTEEYTTKDTLERPDIQIGEMNRDAVTVLTCLLIAVLLFFIIRRFYYGRDMDTSEDDKGLGKDTIYGHNWNQEIPQLMNKGEYGEVAVLCYLRWLEKLDNSSAILFHHSKTPDIMKAEAVNYASTLEQPARDALVAKTEELTGHYLRIRYGHRKIDRATAEKLIAL